MSIVIWWFDPNSPELAGESATPAMLPVALAEAEEKLPCECSVNLGKLI
jgi:hypothetical protein